MKKKIIVSAFDGCSGAQIALERSGIPIKKYYALEIDKAAIEMTQDNYPDTIQLGDVTAFKRSMIPEQEIDLLIGGSPCRGFSSAGKGLNFQDEESKLFFEFVRLKKILKPKWFVLENVVMKKEWEQVITKHMGVEPFFCNSRLVSGQDRKRCYWTNIPKIQLPLDRGITFQDIVQGKGYCAAMRGRKIDPLTQTRKDESNFPFHQYIECREDDKSNCVTTVEKDNVVVKTKGPRRLASETEYRYLNPIEYERLQTMPEGYTKSASDWKRREIMGKGFTIDVITHILSYLPNARQPQLRDLIGMMKVEGE